MKLPKINFKKKHTQKGMTLIECIVALAIYSIIALLMVRICTSICAVRTSTFQFNRKQTFQSPIAENQITSSSDKLKADNTAAGPNDDVTITVTCAGGSTQIKAQKYQSKSQASVKDAYHTRHNFKYFVIDTANAGVEIGATEAATTEAPTT